MGNRNDNDNKSDNKSDNRSDATLLYFTAYAKKNGKQIFLDWLKNNKIPDKSHLYLPNKNGKFNYIYPKKKHIWLTILRTIKQRLYNLLLHYENNTQTVKTKMLIDFTEKHYETVAKTVIIPYISYAKKKDISIDIANEWISSPLCNRPLLIKLLGRICSFTPNMYNYDNITCNELSFVVLYELDFIIPFLDLYKLGKTGCQYILSHFGKKTLCESWLHNNNKFIVSRYTKTGFEWYDYYSVWTSVEFNCRYIMSSNYINLNKYDIYNVEDTSTLLESTSQSTSQFLNSLQDYVNQCILDYNIPNNKTYKQITHKCIQLISKYYETYGKTYKNYKYIKKIIKLCIPREYINGIQSVNILLYYDKYCDCYK
jgi:hypothetical protein